MLMVMCVDSRVDFGSPPLGILSRVHCIGVQDTSKLDLQLNSTILVEDPVDAVFVVGGSEDVRNDELTSSSDDDRIITEVSVLEQDACIFFVNANCVLDGGTLSCSVDKCSILISDGC